MIAHVIPLKRLPRRFTVFDYYVPERLVKQIESGQLVLIPFRSTTLLGLVFELSDTTGGVKPGLKEITEIYNKFPILLPFQLALLKQYAAWYGVSYASFARLLLPPLQKKKLATTEFFAKEKIFTETALLPLVVTYADEDEKSVLLKKFIAGTTLILVPEEHRIEPLRSLLATNSVSWQSTLSPKEQFARWVGVRNDEPTVIVGTRSAVFLPFVNLNTIIIDDEYHEQHKQWDGAPLFDARDVAEVLSRHHSAQIVRMGSILSLRSFFETQKGGAVAHFSEKKSAASEPIVLSLSEERRAHNYGLLASVLEEKLLHTTDDILLLLNRLGYATQVGCSICGFIAKCDGCTLPLIFHQKTSTIHCHYCRTTLPLPLACPTCRAPVLALRGAGTEQLERTIRSLFGERKTHEIIRIDSESDTFHTRTELPRLIIGTNMALPFVRWKKTGLVAWLNIDESLALPEYAAIARTWYLLHDIEYKRTNGSDFFIQTYNRRHLIFRSLKEPERFYRTELSLRKGLGYPPYQFLIRYLFGHPDIRMVKKEAEAQYARFVGLTTLSSKPILTPPLELSPRYYRGKFWYTIIVKLEKTNWKTDIAILNTTLAEGWKVDPSPLSLLTP